MPEIPHSAPSSPVPIRAFGCRRVTLDMRAWIDRADQFKGFERGTAKPLTFLFAFQEAEPHLPLPAHSYKLVSWLVGMTKPQDWEEGSRPIAWPSAQRQAEFLGLSLHRVKALNRTLAEAGIFVMRDNPQGRRYGHRDKLGRITEAYGFDLSLLAERFAEFKNIAYQAQLERNRVKKMKWRISLARRALRQAAEELDRQGHDGEQLRRLMHDAAELIKAASTCTRSDELELAARSLERMKGEAEQMLRELVKAVDINPMGVENDPHSTSTTLTSDNINYTVIARRGSSQVGAEAASQHPSPSSQPQRLFPETLKITPVQLVELAPRLSPYMPARFNDNDWASIVEAALWLSGEMKVNRTLWTSACQVMGREYAAVAIAIVSTKKVGPNRDHGEISSPGQYFAGILRKFERDPADLRLARTLWKLKDHAWGKAVHTERRHYEKQRRIENTTRRGPRSAFNRPVAGFVPVNTAREYQPSTPPQRHLLAPPAATTPASDISKTWNPTPEYLEQEQRIKAMFANTKKNDAQ